MPTSNAMINKPLIKASPKTTVSDALDLFEENNIRGVPVVDKENRLIGFFNLQHLLKTLLPLPEDLGCKGKGFEISLDHLHGQTCWVSGRLQRYLEHPIKEMMNTEPKFIHPDTPLREAVRFLALYGSPLAVVEEDTNKLVGLVSFQSVLKVLLEMKVDLKRNNSDEN